MNQPIFCAENYRQYRPEYPSGIFDEACDVLKSIECIRAVDLGCGTGLSMKALLADGVSKNRVAGVSLNIIGVDIDAVMLSEAKALPCTLILSSAVKTNLCNLSCELVFSGSAYHWFHGLEAFSEVDRLLVPGGVFLGFEYQFPKAIGSDELNQFIKSEFNSRWKAPRQVPRGNFASLFCDFSNSPLYSKKTLKRVEMKRALNLNQFFGHLTSQSRYLHYDGRFNDREKNEYRKDLYSKIEHFFAGDEPLEFDFYFDRIMFVKNG